MSEDATSIWEAGADDLPLHFIIRHNVFVVEQGVIVMTDVDDWDNHPQVVHVLAARGGSCAGTVRLYPVDAAAGRWKGDRLAVFKKHRSTLVGVQLVAFATATAAARGGNVMEAHIQLPNVEYFERLGWQRVGSIYPYLGVAHQSMLFDLSQARAPRCAGRPDQLTIEALDEPTNGEVLCPAA